MIFAESLEFAVDLIGGFSSVAKDQSIDGGVFRIDFELLQSGDDEDGGFSHSGFRLDDHVLTNHGKRNCVLLHFTWMLKASVSDRALKFGLQKHVTKTACLNTSIRTSQNNHETSRVFPK